jgi:quinoprotein dehydrogenase-associated probable ABC transporter substrate-binding protein
MPAWADTGAKALAVVALLAAAPAGAQPTDLVSRTAFRVCADPANLPFSDEAGEGFENEIAALFAGALGRKLEYTWYPMAQGFVRRTLLENRCDVIIGYAQGDELVLNTNHYYTSTYVLVARADGDLADVTALGDPRLQGRRIGVIAGTPPASHLAEAGLLPTTVSYQLMVDTRFEHPNQQMLDDLIAGKIDAALMWGPIGGPLAKPRGDALKVTPLLGDPTPPRLAYRITMGVRPGEDRWKRELNSTIRKLQPEIDAILRRWGVPLLNDDGTALKPET